MSNRVSALQGIRHEKSYGARMASKKVRRERRHLYVPKAMGGKLLVLSGDSYGRHPQVGEVLQRHCPGNYLFTRPLAVPYH